MEIICSVRSVGIKDLEKKIEVLYSNGIRKYRINLKTVTNQKHLNSYKSFINNLINKYHDIKLIIDVDFPSTTPRIHIKNKSNYITVKENEVIKVIYFNKNHCMDGVIYVDRFECEVKIGDLWIIGDGNFEGNVVAVNQGSVDIRVNKDGDIWDGRPVHCNNCLVEVRDIAVIKNIIESIPKKNIFGIALSFVHDSNDIIRFKSIFGNEYNVITKIEDGDGILNSTEICAYSDYAYIGRGDLLYFSKPYDFIDNIKHIVKSAKLKECPFIIGTDILESFSESVIPNRADAVDLISMLSFEPDFIVLSTKVSMSRNIVKCIDYINKTNYK